MITQVPLDTTLAESLQQIAARQGASLEEVLDQLVQKYLRESRRAKLQAEFARYQAQHADLKVDYLGRHIAFYEGRVIDHDLDPDVLVRRVRRRYGHLPVLFVQVEEAPIQEYVIRSPRWVESA
jgi:hypothetical protein